MLNKAKHLIKDGEFELAQNILFGLLKESPHDAEVNYHIASAYDTQGKERQAIPYYENALVQNITGVVREETFIQLGSSYRCIGEYQKAKIILSQGLRDFPENPAIKTFLAMTLYNLNEGKTAVSILLNLVTESSNDQWLNKYQRAIKSYAKNLDESF